MSETKIILPKMDAEKVADEIGDFVLENVINRGKFGCVIGLSGGVDSTVTAALIKRAFDKYNKGLDHAGGWGDPMFELVGYVLPSTINDPADTEDGIKVAERLGIRYEVQSIDKIVDAYRTTNIEALQKDYHKGNLMSRIRANVLNTKAATEQKVLSGTGNKDEDFCIGYYTLFGDGAVHMSPIGGLSKRLVRQMAGYLGFSDLADREPTAGLEPGQTDFKDLGYSYDVVELVMEGEQQMTNGFAGMYCTPQDLAEHSQIAPLLKKEAAQYKSMYGKKRFDNATKLVEDIMRRHEIAREKAKLVSPAIAQVTLEYKR
ncbi:MAG: NAD(+) synthase [Candidatus Woesearchaeota archaeon]